MLNQQEGYKYTDLNSYIHTKNSNEHGYNMSKPFVFNLSKKIGFFVAFLVNISFPAPP